KDSLDFSFSGIKTAVLYYVNKSRSASKRLDKDAVSDICYAFQEAVLDVLVEKACLASRITGCRRIVIGGGVAANNRLRKKFAEAGKLHGLKIYVPEKRYCLDNAAMVGALGEELYRRGHRSDLYLNADPNLAY
ncbi:MAG: tRNA (adenosine(37)-N6)-threonylcarbamoyltransferase complex transferase subunit TsaD, partial [Candidatus Omnitrophica bacterium]|nr:tRNA (adenosine(37)-N6)-threonylcarbamoyltransferase complex transferase subunit TsaD [Candidatus Omnitrophota bacterium]